MRKCALRVAIAALCAGVNLSAAADENTTISGKSFIDFTSVDQKVDGTKTTATGIGLDVKRFYLGVNHMFDDMWSANVTTDFNYAGKTTETQETQVFIKKAYLQAKFNDAAIVRAGSADMPWIPFVEDLYGYRYVENTLIDRTKFGNSADWGLHLGGSAMDNMVSYALSAVNGNGYKNPTRSKREDFEGRVSIMPVTGLVVGAGFYSGKLGQDIEGVDTANTATRLNGVIAYTQDMFRIGAEYFNAKNFSATAVSTGPEDKADGYSVFGSVSPTNGIAVFARYDEVKPAKDTNPDLKDKYYNVGVSYAARKNVDLALAYKNDKISDSTETKTSEIGIWSQVKF